jgi:uncharacterized cupin superfamily protein
MRLINQSNVPTDRKKSPKGVFALARQHVSLALGGVRDKGPWGGGHPFDVERVVLFPGKRNWPYHAHAAQTEYYIVLSGRGRVTDGKGRAHPVKPGDHFIFMPGEAHQIFNPSKGNLEYLVIADHHPADVTSYPNTGKRALKPEGRCVRVDEADYFEGEE